MSEEEDFEDAASQEDAVDPVLQVMLAVAGSDYSAWTRADASSFDKKRIMKHLTLQGGSGWLEKLHSAAALPADTLSHLQKIQSFISRTMKHDSLLTKNKKTTVDCSLRPSQALVA